MDIGVPGTDFHKQWGGILTDHVICSKGSIEFDMELAAGSADYYGFAIIPEGSVLNDRANGTGIGYYHESEADDFIATLATLPQQPLGGLGGGSYPVADLKTARHVVVSVNGSTITTTVDGTPAGDFADIEPTCGSPLIAVWGGATLHLDHVLVR